MSPVVRHGDQINLFPVGDVKEVEPGEIIPCENHTHRVHKVTLTVRVHMLVAQQTMGVAMPAYGCGYIRLWDVVTS